MAINARRYRKYLFRTVLMPDIVFVSLPGVPHQLFATCHLSDEEHRAMVAFFKDIKAPIWRARAN